MCAFLWVSPVWGSLSTYLPDMSFAKFGTFSAFVSTTSFSPSHIFIFPLLDSDDTIFRPLWRYPWCMRVCSFFLIFFPDFQIGSRLLLSLKFAEQFLCHLQSATELNE